MIKEPDLPKPNSAWPADFGREPLTSAMRHEAGSALAVRAASGAMDTILKGFPRLERRGAVARPPFARSVGAGEPVCVKCTRD